MAAAPAGGGLSLRLAVGALGERQLRKRLLTGDLHFWQQHRTTLNIAADLGIAANANDITQHLLQVAGDSDLADWILNLAVFHPETSCATRVVASHAANALSHQFSHHQPSTKLFQHGGKVATMTGNAPVMNAASVTRTLLHA